MTQISPPAWDLSSEYTGYQDEVLKNDQEVVKQNISKLRELTDCLSPLLENDLSEDVLKPYIETIWSVMKLEQETEILLFNIHVYAMLQISTNNKDKEAKQLSNQAKKTLSQFTQALQPQHSLLKRCSAETFESILENPLAKEGQFLLEYHRKTKDQLLSLKEENLMTSLSIDGIQAWGVLYNNLTSSISCEMEEHPSMGFAQTLAMLANRNEKIRQSAYRAIDKSFQPHLESFAAMINAISGWRLEAYQKRSHKKQVHFLDAPLHANRISRETLETMIGTVKEYQWLGQKACQLMARVMGKEKLDPWDTLASGPPTASEHQSERSFDEALKMIINAFNQVHPSMGEFVEMMAEKQWIEATISPNKRAGAYCTKFLKSRTPRVYMTFLGSNKDILTLAHELGHAFHNWVMKDMPLKQVRYPMTLAETASTFAEATLRDYLVQQAQSPEEKLEILWQQNSAASRFLINLPVRFDFEKTFYEQRAHKIFTPEDLSQLMSEKWMNWYGDEFMNEPNPLFWAKKLHFYITSTSFYNFPYTFGYLFSQGVYAQKEKLGDKFFDFYQDILKDTGRMTAEELIQKHLDMDLTQPEFWIDCLKIAEEQVGTFEQLSRELGYE